MNANIQTPFQIFNPTRFLTWIFITTSHDVSYFPKTRWRPMEAKDDNALCRILLYAVHWKLRSYGTLLHTLINESHVTEHFLNKYNLPIGLWMGGLNKSTNLGTNESNITRLGRKVSWKYKLKNCWAKEMLCTFTRCWQVYFHYIRANAFKNWLDHGSGSNLKRIGSPNWGVSLTYSQ